MYRLFTLDEANELLPMVDRHLDDLQGTVRDMLDLRTRLNEMDPHSVEARNAAVELNFLLTEIHDAKGRIDALGVQLKDVERGTVDFPAKLGGEVVFYTWAKGQDAITHYHRLTADESLHPLPSGAHPPRDPNVDPNVGA